MSTLCLKLFGFPKICLDNKEITFSFAKIEALLCYMAVTGRVNRDEIAGILWSDKSDTIARKNLRNTIYQANKILGGDYIVSPTRNTLEFNSSVELQTDVHDFLEEPSKNLELYGALFLEGFYLKDADEFEYWLSRKRDYYEQVYREACYDWLGKQGLETPGAESILHRLIEMDEFEEKNYQLLMTFYKNNKQNNKVAEVYYHLVDLLERELGVSPSQTTKNIYQSIFSSVHDSSDKNRLSARNTHFFGRLEERCALDDYLIRVLKGEKIGPCVISGESGVGKTRLLHQVLLSYKNSFRLVKKDWSINSVHEILENVVFEESSIPLLVILEGCQDLSQTEEQRLAILVDTLANLRYGLILTTSEDFSPILCAAVRPVQDILLKNFNEEESLDYIRQAEKELPMPVAEEIVFYSQGNPFFLTEYLLYWHQQEIFNPLPSTVKQRFSLVWDGLSEIEKELLQYLSCFRSEVPLSLIANILELPLMEISSIVDGCVGQRILLLRERDEHLFVIFDKRIFALYCYDNLSLVKKRLLHQRIAQKLEVIGSGDDVAIYKEMAYHYRQAKNILQSLSCELTFLEKKWQFRHELFPIYAKQSSIINLETPLKNDSILATFENLRKELSEAEHHYKNSRELKMLQLRFLYMEGRHLIRSGDYQKGIHDIQEVIVLAKELKEFYFLLEGYRQVIYYCIQTENLEEMSYYTDLALEAAVQDNNHEAIALHLRLKGLYHLMMGDEEQATRYLYQSIDCFSLTHSLQKKYSIQIAAALDYLAEIEQIRGNFSVAQAHQIEAIGLVDSNMLEPFSVTFYIGLGITYYLKGDFQQAEIILEKAKQILVNLSFPWKEAQLELYLALIEYGKQNYIPIFELLKKQDIIIERYSNPRDKGMMYFLLAFLSYKKSIGEFHHEEIGKLLTMDFYVYAEIAEQYLNSYRDTYHLAELKEMKINIQNCKKS